MPKKKDDARKWKPESLRFDLTWVNGVALYSAFAINSIVPVGSVWVQPTSMKPVGAKNWCGVAYILDIYVPQKYRRMGIGTWMMKSLLGMYGILQTGTGTDEGGMALMKSLGWKQAKETGDWYLRGTPKPLAK